MHRTLRCLFAASITLALALPAGARQPEQETRAAMKKLDFLIGKWKGRGTMLVRGNRDTFTQSSSLAYKLGGSVLVMDSTMQQENMETGQAEQTAASMTIITYDPDSRKYRLHVYQANGRHVAAEAVLDGPRKLTWSYEHHQGGRVRYSATVTSDHRFKEVGEYSKGGKGWVRVLELRLDKI